MNLWKTNLSGIDIENGDNVLFVTKDGVLHWGYTCSAYDYNDDFSHYYIRNQNNEDYEGKDIICWAYLNDFLRTVPREVLRSGLTADTIQSDYYNLCFTVRYLRYGKEETRLFYTREDAFEFLHTIDIDSKSGTGILKRIGDVNDMDVFYLDKCWD